MNPEQQPLFNELWISLASLLRSYTAVHGLSRNQQATIESDSHRVRVNHKEKWLELKRNGPSVAWMRENGSSGHFELTEDGRLRGLINATNKEKTGEEEMDMAAEAWARELMG